MALLHFQNLGISNPESVMRRVVGGLRIFNQYLRRTEEFLKSDEAMLRLEWKSAKAPGGPGLTQGGSWVELIEPKDRPNEPESTFRAFLDENNRELYEADQLGVNPIGRKSEGYRFDNAMRISILDRDPETNRVQLERSPERPTLLLRPDTYSLSCQISAIRSLQNSPSPDHLPLLRLMETAYFAQWPQVETAPFQIEDWSILKEGSRPGTESQRRFVQIALATPDFAFLEGPPGSGKTTAICELILQLVRRKQRILLCASTHVAVDNVLERLVNFRDDLIPVRIGENRNISEAVKHLQFTEFVRTEKAWIRRFLEKHSPRSAAQNTLLDAIRDPENKAIEEMILNAANLVCGTTMGILQHPEIKSAKSKRSSFNPQFDVMIIDEASKTTFQEFLVPALLAKRWIIVGDPRQLSPYVEEFAMSSNIGACLQSEVERNACVDVFLAARNNPDLRRSTIVVSDDPEMLKVYSEQANQRAIIVTNEASEDLPMADIVFIRPDQIDAVADQLPLDLSNTRGIDEKSNVISRRIDAWRVITDPKGEYDPRWENEVGWRLERLYEQRLAPDGGTTQRLETELKELLPVRDSAAVWEDIDQVQRVGLPSVLESLQCGFGKKPGQKNGTALSEGLPKDCLKERHTLLEFQQRMHPEISAFSREHIYMEEALKDPPEMENNRNWQYPRYQYRAIWIDVRGSVNKRFNHNRDEARIIIEELKKFVEWARMNPPEEGGAWTAAILTFYRGQEREIREYIRRYSGQRSKFRHFDFKNLRLELCTVDRFQGHEADMVFISFMNDHSTSFLESPNRLNVALTRARYQRIIVGNRIQMKKSRGSILRKLAETQHGENIYGGEG